MHMVDSIANNNPGNLRVTNQPWLGKTTTPGAVFETFDTAEHGLRAMVKILLSDFKNGTNTIESIINKWAPPSENNTNAYIDAVSDSTAIDSDTVLSPTPDVLAKLVAAIVLHETGKQPYDKDLINQAVKDALS